MPNTTAAGMLACAVSISGLAPAMPASVARAAMASPPTRSVLFRISRSAAEICDVKRGAIPASRA